MTPAQVPSLELLLSISGAFILVLFGVLAFWIQKWINSTDALTEAVNNLKVLFATTQANLDEIQKHCDARCISIDIRLSEQTKRLQEATIDIAVLQSKVLQK